MTRMRILTVLVIAVLAGGGLAAGTYRYLQNVPVKTVSVPTRSVVVANSDLTLGSELRRDDLALVEWPAGSVPEGSFDKIDSVVGRGLVATVVKHEAILDSKLASKEAGSGLPPIIPPGKRAVSVRVNEVIGVAGYVLPGTHVDVLATANPSNRAEDMTSKVVLSNVQVLTAGTRLETKDGDSKPVQVTVVTLLVTPEESEKLTLASTEGKIQLALRNPLDADSPATGGVRTSALMGGAQRTLPAAAVTVRRTSGGAGAKQPQVVPVTVVPPPPTVEIIRGDKRVQVVVG
jgi:pilus assembly protein CpaB